MSECISIKHKAEQVTFTVKRDTVSAVVGINSSVVCKDGITISSGPVVVKTDPTEQVTLKVTNRINIQAARAAPKAQNLYVLDENTDPCDIVTTIPVMVLKKVIVEGVPKYKWLVVEPPA